MGDITQRERLKVSVALSELEKIYVLKVNYGIRRTRELKRLAREVIRFARGMRRNPAVQISTATRSQKGSGSSFRGYTGTDSVDYTPPGTVDTLTQKGGPKTERVGLYKIWVTGDGSITFCRYMQADFDTQPNPMRRSPRYQLAVNFRRARLLAFGIETKKVFLRLPFFNGKLLVVTTMRHWVYSFCKITNGHAGFELVLDSQ